MQITVKLFATFRINRDKIMTLEVEDGTTPRMISERLEIPVVDVAIIMVNGRAVTLDHILVANDVLALFPPVGGG